MRHLTRISIAFQNCYRSDTGSGMMNVFNKKDKNGRYIIFSKIAEYYINDKIFPTG